MESNKLTEMLEETVCPQMAIIVYSGRKDSRNIYLEQRPIKNGKMGAGRPLSKKCISEIICALAEDTDEIEIGFHGVIPRTLLFSDISSGRKKLVWYNPPRKHRMCFTKSLGLPDGEMSLPGIVYEVNNNSLNVYAFKGKTPKKDLYIAPFFNISGGLVCLGNANAKKPKNQTYEEEIAYWEKMFWESEFSHLGSDNPVEGNLSTITKECIVNGTPFPMNVLKKANKNLKELLK